MRHQGEEEEKKKREQCEPSELPRWEERDVKEGGQKPLEFVKCKQSIYCQCGTIAGGKLCNKPASVWRAASHGNHDLGGEDMLSLRKLELL